MWISLIEAMPKFSHVECTYRKENIVCVEEILNKPKNI